MILDQVQTLVNVIYPARCVGCGDLVEGDLGLCGPCWRETPFLSGVCCDCCAAPLPGGVVGEVALCDACLTTERHWIRGRSVLRYEGATRQLVLRLKHGDRTDIARPAGLWIARAARALIAKDTVLVPVPLHRWRFARRSYNQAALLAAEAALQLGVQHCPDGLIRTRATAPMKGHKQDRISAIENAISINPKRADRLAGKPILLVNDVMTTGATLGATAQALTVVEPRKIDVITLARVAMEG